MDTLHLKNLINELKDENSKLKTKLLTIGVLKNKLECKKL